MPDVINIGQHAFALTLNLLYTIIASLVAGVVLYKWKRKVEYDEKIKRDLIEAREAAEKHRHGEVIELIDGRHNLVIDKIEDYCKRSEKRFSEIKRDFDNHYHDEDNTVIIKRGGM